MSDIHEGCLIIADITGYTRYLKESELKHAQDTLTALLELLVEKTRPPLVISRLAGDAVISYGLAENFFHWQTFVEKIEDTYVAFRKAIDLLVINNTCRCNACANISNLDLKFFIHYGTFGIQHISDHDELVGSDINLLHRLLKNSVEEKTGYRGYTFYTEAVIKHFDVTDAVESMTPHREVYEHLGEVKGWVQDMHPVWEKKRSEQLIAFPGDNIKGRYAVDIRMPREQVWDYLVQPEFRKTLIGSDKMEISNRSQGRIGPGSIYQCYHGDKVIPQTILEWQPLERMIVKELFPLNPATSFLSEYRLDSTDNGTVLTRSIGSARGPILGRLLLRLLMPIFDRMTSRQTAKFADTIESDYQKRIDETRDVLVPGQDQIRRAAAESLQDLENGQPLPETAGDEARTVRFSNDRLPITLEYPDPTPLGFRVVANEIVGDGSYRVHLISDGSDEIYFEIGQYSRLSLAEAMEAFKTDVSERIENLSFGEVIETSIGSQTASRLTLRWPDKEREIYFLEKDGMIYRIICNPRAPINRQILQSVRFL